MATVKQMHDYEKHVRDKVRAQAEKKKTDKEKSANDEPFVMSKFDVQNILHLPVSEIGLKLTHKFTVYESSSSNKRDGAFC